MRPQYIFRTCSPDGRQFSLLCVLYVLAMRDETKQPETYTTKKKKENWSKKSVIIVIMFVARLVKSSFRPILD